MVSKQRTKELFVLCSADYCEVNQLNNWEGTLILVKIYVSIDNDSSRFMSTHLLEPGQQTGPTYTLHSLLVTVFIDHLSILIFLTMFRYSIEARSSFKEQINQIKNIKMFIWSWVVDWFVLHLCSDWSLTKKKQVSWERNE